MKLLLALATLLATSPTFAAGYTITRFGLRCDGPFFERLLPDHGTLIGKNYQTAGTDPSFASVDSLGDGSVIVEFKPAIAPASLSAIIEGTRAPIPISDPTPHSATLHIGECEINSVVVVILKGSPQ